MKNLICIMISEGLSAREKHGLSNQIKSKAEDAHVKMLTISVHVDIWIGGEGLRHNNNPHT